MSEMPHHDCIWEVLGVRNQDGSVIHPRIAPSTETTTVLLRCTYCKVVITNGLQDRWTEDQVRGTSGGNDTTTN
jgi:hypothetical protein